MSIQPIEQLTEFIPFFFLQLPMMPHQLLKHFDRPVNGVPQPETILQREKTPRTSTIFWWTGACAADTGRIRPLRVYGQHSF
jgi:hypothetical protein